MSLWSRRPADTLPAFQDLLTSHITKIEAAEHRMEEREKAFEDSLAKGEKRMQLVFDKADQLADILMPLRLQATNGISDPVSWGQIALREAVEASAQTIRESIDAAVKDARMGLTDVSQRSVRAVSVLNEDMRGSLASVQAMLDRIPQQAHEADTRLRTQVEVLSEAIARQLAELRLSLKEGFSTEVRELLGEGTSLAHVLGTQIDEAGARAHESSTKALAEIAAMTHELADVGERGRERAQALATQMRSVEMSVQQATQTMEASVDALEVRIAPTITALENASKLIQRVSAEVQSAASEASHVHSRTTEQAEVVRARLDATLAEVAQLCVQLQVVSTEGAGGMHTAVAELEEKTALLRAAVQEDIREMRDTASEAATQMQTSMESARTMARTASVTSAELVRALVPLETRMQGVTERISAQGDAMAGHTSRIEQSIERVGQVTDTAAEKLHGALDQIHTDADKLAQEAARIEASAAQATQPLAAMSELAHTVSGEMDGLTQRGTALTQTLSTVSSTVRNADQAFGAAASTASEAVEALDRAAASSVQRLAALTDSMRDNAASMRSGFDEAETRIEQVGERARSTLDTLTDAAEGRLASLAEATVVHTETATSSAEQRMARVTQTIQGAADQAGQHVSGVVDAFQNKAESMAARMAEAARHQSSEVAEASMQHLAMVEETGRGAIEALKTLLASGSQADDAARSIHRAADEARAALVSGTTLLTNKIEALLDHAVQAMGTEKVNALQAQLEETLGAMESGVQKVQDAGRKAVEEVSSEITQRAGHADTKTAKALQDAQAKALPLLVQEAEAGVQRVVTQAEARLQQLATEIQERMGAPKDTIVEDMRKRGDFMARTKDTLAALSGAGLELSVLIDPSTPASSRMGRILSRPKASEDHLSSIFTKTPALKDLATEFVGDVQAVLAQARTNDPEGVFSELLETSDLARLAHVVQRALAV